MRLLVSRPRATDYESRGGSSRWNVPEMRVCHAVGTVLVYDDG